MKKIKSIKVNQSNNPPQSISTFLSKDAISSNQPYLQQKTSITDYSIVILNGKEKILGTGAQSTVYLVKTQITKQNISNPSYPYAALKLTSVQVTSEISLQSKLNNPRIVKLLDFKTDYISDSSKEFPLTEKSKINAILLEYCPNGNLFNYLRQKKTFSEEEAFKYFSQTIEAISYLHSNRIIHRDIKPENILLDEGMNIKISDFGWGVEIADRQRDTFCGTFEYMAPEIINEIPYDEAIDVWSLGVLLYEMLHGESPFKSDYSMFKVTEIFEKIKTQQAVIKEGLSFEVSDLILRLLEKDAIKRIKISDVLKHQWFISNGKRVGKGSSGIGNIINTVNLKTFVKLNPQFKKKDDNDYEKMLNDKEKEKMLMEKGFDLNSNRNLKGDGRETVGSRNSAVVNESRTFIDLSKKTKTQKTLSSLNVLKNQNKVKEQKTEDIDFINNVISKYSSNPSRKLTLIRKTSLTESTSYATNTNNYKKGFSISLSGNRVTNERVSTKETIKSSEKLTTMTHNNNLNNNTSVNLLEHNKLLKTSKTLTIKKLDPIKKSNSKSKPQTFKTINITINNSQSPPQTPNKKSCSLQNMQNNDIIQTTSKSMDFTPVNLNESLIILENAKKNIKLVQKEGFWSKFVGLFTLASCNGNGGLSHVIEENDWDDN